MNRRAVRKYPLLCTAFLFVPAGTAEGDIEFPLIKRLAQAFGLHDLRMERRTGCDRGYATLESVVVDMHEQIHLEARGGFITERDHFTKFPGRIDVQ